MIYIYESGLDGLFLVDKNIYLLMNGIFDKKKKKRSGKHTFFMVVIRINRESSTIVYHRGDKK
jgi:hypothetical protein